MSAEEWSSARNDGEKRHVMDGHTKTKISFSALALEGNLYDGRRHSLKSRKSCVDQTQLFLAEKTTKRGTPCS